MTPELFYAIGHSRVHVTLASALAVSHAERLAAINHAIEASICTSAFAATAATQLATLEGLRSNYALVDSVTGVSSRLAILLAIAGITNSSSPTNAAVMAAYMNYAGALETFWTTPNTGLSSAQLTDVQNALALGIYTLNHPPMVASLWGAGIHTPAALAQQTEAQLVTRIGTNVTVPLPSGSSYGPNPVGVPGEVTSGTAADYAHAIATAVSRAYPSGGVVGGYTANPLSGTTGSGANVGTFFSANPTFDFAAISVRAFVRANPGAFSGNAGAQPLVERMARLFKISPEVGRYSTIQALWNAGFDSARAIFLYGREPFIALMTSATYGWSTSQAAQVYAKASHTSALASAIAMKYGGSFQAPGAGGVIPQLGLNNGVISPPSSIPDWSSMFGNLNYCACDECASVLGAAAYLTDLLHFLEQRPSGATPTMLTTLKSRRPDVTKIQLSCINTNTILPTIDIVNEVLELRIHPTTVTPYQTTWTQDQLAVHPEHLLAAAYDDLQTKIFPWSMPYSLYLDEGRTYVGLHKVTRAEIRAAAVPDGVADDAWAKEILQMTELQRQVIQGSGSLISGYQPKDYWGIGASPPTPWYSSFAALPVVLAASGLSYEDAAAIISTSYVTAAPTSPAGPVSINLHGGCDISSATLDGLDLTSTAHSTPFFDEMHRFTRLWRALGWTIRQTDRAIMNLGAGTLDTNLIAPLAYAKEIVRRTGAALDDVLTWRAGTAIDTAADPVSMLSPFELLFPSKGSGTSSNIFALNTARTALADETKPLATYLPTIAAALGTDLTSIQAIVTYESLTSANLTLVNISTLFRYVTLARALKLSVSSLLVLLSIAGRAPFDAAHKDHAIRLIDDATDATSYGLSPELVRYILWHVDTTTPKSTTVSCTVNLAASQTFAGATLDASGNVKTVGQLVASIPGHPELTFTNLSAVTSTSAGNYTATFICTQAGAVQCSAGTLTVIPTPIAGWNSITNPNNGVVGNDGVYTPTDVTVSTFLAALRDALVSISSKPVASDATGSVTQTYLKKFYSTTSTPSDSDVAYAIVAGTAPLPTSQGGLNMTETAQNTWIDGHGWSQFIDTTFAKSKLTNTNVSTGALVGLDVRFAYFQPAIQVFIDKQGAAVDHVASALGIKNSVTDAVLRAYVHARTAVGIADTTSSLSLLSSLDANSGVAATISSVTSGVATLTGLAHMTPSSVGRVFDITGAATAANNGSFVITSYISATSVTIANSNAVAGDANNGSIRWLEHVTGPFTLSNATAAWYTYLHLQKVAALLSGLAFTDLDLPWVFGTAAPLALDSLVVVPTTTAGLFAELARLVHAAKARSDFFGSALFDIFQNPATVYANVDALLTDVSARTGWAFADLHNFAAGASPAITALSDFVDERPILRLKAGIDIVKRLGISAATVFSTTANWSDVTYGSAAGGADALAIKEAIRGSFPAEQWVGIAAPIRNLIRQRQRDAMVDYLVHTSTSPVYASADDVSADVLLDVEQQSCGKTSRIVQALASTQTFLERILLGLESGFTLTTDDARQWQWMKHYRVWEANREIFIYPENWIEPSLRDDKTPLFQDFETNIAKQALSDDSVEDALVDYLHGLDEVAHLEVCASVNDTDPDTGDNLFHVVARTRANPPVYYYRTRQKERWLPWQKIDADIHAEHMLLAIYNRRPFLFAVNVTESSKTKDQAKATKQGDVTNAPTKQFQIWLRWTSLRHGKWSKVQQSKTWLPDEKIPLQLAEQLFDVSDPDTDDTTQRTAAERMRRALDSLAFRTRVDTNGDLEITVINTNNVDVLAQDLGGPLKIKVIIPNLPSVTGQLQTHVRWQQFFRLSGGQGIAVADYDPSLYGEYKDLVPRKYNAVGQFLTNDGSVTAGMYLPDVYNYFTWQITTADAQEIQVLGATPSKFSLSITPGDGANWLYDPIFYTDRNRVFFVTPTSIEAQPRTVSSFRLAKIPAADSTAQLGRVWSRSGLSTVNLANTTVTPPTGAPWTKQLVTTVTPLTRPTTHTAYTFYSFYHPFVRDVLKELNRFGVDGVYNAQPNRPGSELRRQGETIDVFATTYLPTRYVTTPYPIDEFDFTPEGAYSIYNWELFFHIPFFVATKLAADQQYDAALKWFHYIFNPSEPESPTSPEPAPQRFWKVKPFYQLTGAETDAQSAINILSLLLSHDDTDPVRLAARKRIQAQIEEWRDNPFDPDVVARLRPVAYMKAVVIKYLDMLIAWGDSLFSQATRESINEAIQIYIMALKTLGTKPTKLPPVTPAVAAYDDLSTTLDDFSDAVTNIEVVLPQVNDDISLDDSDDTPLAARSMYFCVPPNDKLLGYWDTVADRLTKIRNCLSITGEPLNLPLFEPPIDPGLLIAARAAGIDIGSVLEDVESPPPLQRYAVLAQRATELVNEVKAFGAQLLSALEKKDAEALALLRANQEVQLLAAMRTVKQDAIAEANGQLAAANAAQASAVARFDYYNTREFINAPEAVQGVAMIAGGILRTAAAATEGTGAAMQIIPDVDIGVSGWGGHATVKFGGTKFADAAAGGARTLSTLATFVEMTGQAAGLLGTYTRRKDEWDFQKRLAAIDRDQTTVAQIAAATARQQLANDDLAAHDRQYQNAIDARDFMRDKYTNEELYDWMSNQLSALYFQAYKLAYAAAKRAERAWQFELADTSTTFITFGYWESARKGLLAGERLSLDLKRMEMAYLDKDVREFELASHIPLTMLDPIALQQLRETGTCTISIPEAYFDAETAGHYLRRIKTVSVTLAGVSGPYTPVRCTLTLLSSQVRTSPDLHDTALQPSRAAVQAIVTSSGREDGGLFETNLRDDRYLPFERAGAISTWQLDLPETNANNPFAQPLFDYRTLSEVVIHMRYTARDGGQTFRQAVNSSSSAPVSKLYHQVWNVGFSAKNALSDAWYRFISPGAFAPTQLSGLVSWHRADSVTQSGGIVTAWTDLSSNGYNLTPTGSPTFVASATTLGGQPAVQFNGTTQYFTFGGSPSAHTACDVFAVYVCEASSGRSPVWSNRSAAMPSGGTNLYVGQNSGIGYALSDNLPTTSISGGGAFSTRMIQEASFEQSSGLYTLWVNGAQTASGNFTPGTSTANIDLVNGLVGKDGTELFNGKLAELIVFNRRLTDAERAQVTSYLQARYAPTGLTLPIDADHVPFRSSSALITGFSFVRVQKTITAPGSNFNATLSGPSVSGDTITFSAATSTPSLNGQYFASKDYSSSTKTLGNWNLLVDPAQFTADDDLYIVVSYRTN